MQTGITLTGNRDSLRPNVSPAPISSSKQASREADVALTEWQLQPKNTAPEFLLSKLKYTFTIYKPPVA
jgi:hypothetical protein